MCGRWRWLLVYGCDFPGADCIGDSRVSEAFVGSGNLGYGQSRHCR